MGVPQDHVWSYVWNNLAAAEGMKNAAGNRDRLASMMTMTQKVQRGPKHRAEDMSAKSPLALSNCNETCPVVLHTPWSVPAVPSCRVGIGCAFHIHLLFQPLGFSGALGHRDVTLFKVAAPLAPPTVHHFVATPHVKR